MSPEHKLSKQEIMRLAEDVAAGRREASELTNHGITVGDWIEIDKEGFLKLIENQNDKQDSLVFIVLYRDDFPFNDPSEIEEALVEELSKDAVGEWSGAGSGLGERPYFDISFTINDSDKALAVIRSVLREKRVGKSTEIRLSEGTHSVYDQ